MKKLIAVLVCFFISLSVNAQIQGYCNPPNDQALFLAEVLAGNGIQISSANVSGFDCSYGFFDGSLSNIGLNNGVVMATNGLLGITPGGFNSPGVDGGYDADLIQLLQEQNSSSTTLNNLIVLEFEIEPSSNIFTLDYVFASKEYENNVCDDRFDVFGIFISGPGISGPYSNGANNIALIPGPNNMSTNTPVGVNTVNSGVASDGDSAPCDIIDSNWQDYSQYYVDNLDQTSVSYHGFTQPLTAQAVVQACQTYQIKIAIADVGNGAKPSALFLGENSINSPAQTQLSFGTTMQDMFDSDSDYYDYVYEGCGSAFINFIRPESVDISIPMQFEFHLGGSATYGQDYTLSSSFVASSVSIPAGVSSTTLDIYPINDWTDESSETVYFEFDAINYGCYQTAPDTIVFEIHDQPSMSIDITADTTLYCPEDEITLEVTATGGVGGLISSSSLEPPYTFEWDHIGSNPIQVENPLESTKYCVQVSDVCGTQILDTCTYVSVNQYPELVASAESKYLCDDVRDSICVFSEGGEGSYTFIWSNESTDSCIFDFHGEYEVVVTDGCHVEQIVLGELYLDEPPNPYFETLVIPHDTLGVEFNNYTPPYLNLSYHWDFDDGSSSTSLNPIHLYEETDDYYVTLEVETAIAGCTKAYTQFVRVEPFFSFFAPNAFTPNNDDINDVFKPYVKGVNTYEIYIYDSWGNEVFSSFDPDEGWDGTFKGKVLGQGTYSFTAIMTKHSDIVYFQERGLINLIR